MKRAAGCLLLLAGWMVLDSGAQQPPPPVMPGTNAPASTARVEAMSFWTKRQILNEQEVFESRVEALERSIADNRKEQQRLAQEARSLKTRLDEVQANLATTLSRLNQTEQKLAEADAKMPALKTELERQAQMVKAVEESGKSTPKLSGTDAKLADVEKRIRDQEMILRQKEKEIEDLKKFLAARDAGQRKPVVSAAPAGDTTRPAVISMAPAAGQPVTAPAATPAAAPVQQPSAVRPVATPVAVPAVSTQNVVLLTRYINEGNRALREGRMADAEQQFTAAVAIDPSALDGRLGLAACKYMNGMLPEAKTALAEVLKIDPNNAQALGLQGIIAWRENDLSTASTVLNRAIRRSPNDAQLHNYLGITLHSQGFSDDAVKEFYKAIELSPSLTDAHYNLAVVLASLRKPRLEDAKKSYQNALRLGYPRDDKLEQILYAQP